MKMRRTTTAAVVLTILMSGITAVTQAQTPHLSNGIDTTQSGLHLDDLVGHVHALTVYDDGSGPALYAGGWFTTAGGVTTNRIAKWNGTSWSALSGPSGNGMNRQIFALAVYDDGSGPAVIRDISTDGAFIETSEEIPLGAELSFMLALGTDPVDTLPLQCRGRVVRHGGASERGVGVRIDEFQVTTHKKTRSTSVELTEAGDSFFYDRPGGER